MKINLKKLFNIKSKNNKGIQKPDDYYIINSNTKFNTLESYKTARTNIMFSLPKSDKGKVVLITSSEPGEGKTTTSINLSLTFAQTGAKVLLIDCDLRKPRVHRYLKIEKSTGMSNVLCGFIKLEDAIRHNVRDGLDCIPVGEIPPNPAELLASEEMSGILEKLSGEYDYIFIDTPPITTVTDAMVIAPSATGVLLVVRQNQSTYDMIDAAVEILKRSEIKILGFIMNCSEKDAAKYKYYSRKYKYSRGYNYTYRYMEEREQK